MSIIYYYKYLCPLSASITNIGHSRQCCNSVGGPDYSNSGWRLASSVVVCNTARMQRNSPGAARDGGPVVLRPVRVTPCFITYILGLLSRAHNHCRPVCITLGWWLHNGPTAESAIICVGLLRAKCALVHYEAFGSFIFRACIFSATVNIPYRIVSYRIVWTFLNPAILTCHDASISISRLSLFVLLITQLLIDARNLLNPYAGCVLDLGTYNVGLIHGRRKKAWCGPMHVALACSVVVAVAF